MEGLEVINVLLRCTRSEAPDLPFFEKVRQDLDLWVWELGSGTDCRWDECGESIVRELQPYLPALKKLPKDSKDYTLFIAISTGQAHSMVRIPRSLSTLAAEAGFGIDISFE